MSASRFLLTLLTVVIAATLAACGGTPASTTAAGVPDEEPTAAPPADGGDTDTGSLGDFDLCSVLSIDEVAEITDAQVADTTTAAANGVYSCNYNTAEGMPAAGSTLATSEAGVDPSEMFEANRDAEGTEPIDGIGDGAVMTGDEDFPILMVLVGDNLYSLSVLAENLDGPGKREATIEMARRSADRLP